MLDFSCWNPPEFPDFIAFNLFYVLLLFVIIIIIKHLDQSMTKEALLNKSCTWSQKYQQPALKIRKYIIKLIEDCISKCK